MASTQDDMIAELQLTVVELRQERDAAVVRSLSPTPPAR